MGEASVKQKYPEIINTLSLLVKTAQLHDINNDAFNKALNTFLETINPVLSEESISIKIFGDHFYINQMRVSLPVEYINNFDFLIDIFESAGIGMITFRNKLSESDMKIFIPSILRVISSSDPYGEIIKSIQSLDNIIIEEPFKREKDIDIEKIRIIKKTYASAILTVKNIIEKIKQNQKVSFARAKRIIGTIVDQIVQEDLQATLIGMATLKNYDEYTYYHSVNVSIISIAIGNQIGLEKKLLAELGLAALFHDLGKIRIPSEILNKRAKFDEEEWELMKMHPWWSADKILEIRGINDVSINLAISAFEHHLNMDLSGYPEISYDYELDLFSRIIAIADRYDAMTSKRVYSEGVSSPARAIEIMNIQAGKEIDPYLFRVFVNLVGVYPIGSLVMLDTGELGFVIKNKQGEDLIDRPDVLIISDSMGNYIDGKIVDLAKRDSKGRYLRSIVTTLDPQNYGLRLADFMTS